MNLHNEKERLQWYEKDLKRSLLFFALSIMVYLIAGWGVPIFLKIPYIIGVCVLHCVTLIIVASIANAIAYVNEAAKSREWIKDISEKLAEEGDEDNTPSGT